VFRNLVLCSLIWLIISFAAAEVPSPLVSFVERAVQNGEIRYWGAFAVTQSIYHLFTLQQNERKGVLLVLQNGTRFDIVGADTSLDSLAREPNRTELEPVVEAATRLLNGEGNDPVIGREAASPNDICPIGAFLNELLVPIAGVTLRSNGTLRILRDLQHGDAYAIDPERAPPGSILVCPTSFAPEGPVVLGFVVVVGPDRCVYGPDYRQRGAWHRLATLRVWLQANQSVTRVSGFLLRAKQNTQRGSGLHNSAQPQPL
jgi:hypothetical protein